MKKLLKFFLEIEKLKAMPRTGWVLREIENPETITEHTFRLAILAWLLGQKKNLNTEKLIKTALSHDLCEVFAGDIPPFFYYVRSPDVKWVRLSKREKRKRGKKKLKIEEKSLFKLIKYLQPDLKNEIFSYWSNFTKQGSKEGIFVKQVDRIETLIQSIEYFGPREDIAGTTWWEWTEEIVDDPLLLKFLKVIQKKFYGKVTGSYKRNRELENLLDFIVEIGKLKQMPRTLWMFMGIENPETVASHIFAVSLKAWVFGREKKRFDMKKFLKMALCHEIPAVYTSDLITPFSNRLKRNKKRRVIFQKWPRLSKKQKRKKFLQDYRKEKKALRRLTSKLKISLKKEIIQLWEEYKTASTPEASFLNQVNVCAVLLQALQYKKRDKDLPTDWLWEWAFEKCEDSVSLEFIEELKKKFYKNKLFSKAVLSLFRRK